MKQVRRMRAKPVSVIRSLHLSVVANVDAIIDKRYRAIAKPNVSDAFATLEIANLGHAHSPKNSCTGVSSASATRYKREAAMRFFPLSYF